MFSKRHWQWSRIFQSPIESVVEFVSESPIKSVVEFYQYSVQAIDPWKSNSFEKEIVKCAPDIRGGDNFKRLHCFSSKEAGLWQLDNQSVHVNTPSNLNGGEKKKNNNSVAVLGTGTIYEG